MGAPGRVLGLPCPKSGPDRSSVSISYEGPRPDGIVTYHKP